MKPNVQRPHLRHQLLRAEFIAALILGIYRPPGDNAVSEDINTPIKYDRIPRNSPAILSNGDAHKVERSGNIRTEEESNAAYNEFLNIEKPYIKKLTALPGSRIEFSPLVDKDMVQSNNGSKLITCAVMLPFSYKGNTYILSSSFDAEQRGIKEKKFYLRPPEIFRCYIVSEPERGWSNGKWFNEYIGIRMQEEEFSFAVSNVANKVAPLSVIMRLHEEGMPRMRRITAASDIFQEVNKGEVINLPQ